MLQLKAEKRTLNNFKYTSGMVTTLGKFAFKYGYTEAKMKVPAGKAMWPAFWALPTDKKLWPPELDAMEVLGQQPNKVYMTVLWPLNGNPAKDVMVLKG